MTSNVRRNRTAILSDPHYREILAVLEDAKRPLHITELAEQLVKRDETMISADEYERQLKQERLSLHHNSLPRLAEYGVIDYDLEENIVSSRPNVVTEIDWLDEDVFDQLLAKFPTDSQSTENPIGVLEGRQAAVEYGKQLADEAEEELFCMYVSTDLLEEECLSHAEDALNRGVELYLGSQNPEVCDLCRKRLPEVTLWEPQHTWLRAPSEYPTVSRLVLVDRRKVMLAILDEPNSDSSYPEERTIVGDGEDNPLVVLVRELLGPRLDHLDYQSPDFQSEIHS
ncbi:hypothetical protein SAMN05421858_4571 [Haladaptatus litoreus]|uniref:DUF7344 domain-containing protein n=2 Tax=Haladaptatus litoreus TaxID=553468 RepID=A0A1N7EWL4_9EURY|nr:hypothetical protein SAMN05421858_4571 [Haladaptatus litoreus]